MFKFVCFNFWKHTKIIQVRLYNACYFQSNSVEDLQWGGWVGVDKRLAKSWPLLIQESSLSFYNFICILNIP